MFSVHVLPHCKTSWYDGYCFAQRNKFLLNNIPYSAKRPITGQPEFPQDKLRQPLRTLFSSHRGHDEMLWEFCAFPMQFFQAWNNVLLHQTTHYIIHTSEHPPKPTQNSALFAVLHPSSALRTLRYASIRTQTFHNLKFMEKDPVTAWEVLFYNITFCSAHPACLHAW